MSNISIEQAVNGLIDRIELLDYTTAEGYTYHLLSQTKKVREQEIIALRNVIREWASENIDVLQRENAMLEAKIYTYEQIIANSNFKATITKNKDIEEMKASIAETNERLKEMDSNLVLAFGDLFKEIKQRESENKA